MRTRAEFENYQKRASVRQCKNGVMLTARWHSSCCPFWTTWIEPSPQPNRQGKSGPGAGRGHGAIAVSRRAQALRNHAHRSSSPAFRSQSSSGRHATAFRSAGQFRVQVLEQGMCFTIASCARARDRFDRPFWGPHQGRMISCQRTNTIATPARTTLTSFKGSTSRLEKVSKCKKQKLRRIFWGRSRHHFQRFRILRDRLS